MFTLCIRYTLNPNKLADFKAYAEAEQGPISQSGGKTLGYFLPTDFAGPTNEAMGLIDFSTLAAYEQYRSTLANDPDHQKNVARLEQCGAVVAMDRSIIQRLQQVQEK
jgi:NIPSNAP